MPPPLRSSLLDCRSLHGKAGNAPRPVYYATPQSKGTTAFRCAPVGVRRACFTMAQPSTRLWRKCCNFRHYPQSLECSGNFAFPGRSDAKPYTSPGFQSGVVHQRG